MVSRASTRAPELESSKATRRGTTSPSALPHGPARTGRRDSVGAAAARPRSRPEEAACPSSANPAGAIGARSDPSTMRRTRRPQEPSHGTRRQPSRRDTSRQTRTGGLIFREPRLPSPASTTTRQGHRSSFPPSTRLPPAPEIPAEISTDQWRPRETVAVSTDTRPRPTDDACFLPSSGYRSCFLSRVIPRGYVVSRSSPSIPDEKT